MQSRQVERRPGLKGELAEHTISRMPATTEASGGREETFALRQELRAVGPKKVDCDAVFWTWALRRS